MKNLKKLAILAIEQREDLTGLLLTEKSLSLQYSHKDTVVHEDGKDFRVMTGGGTLTVKGAEIFKTLGITKAAEKKPEKQKGAETKTEKTGTKPDTESVVKPAE